MFGIRPGLAAALAHFAVMPPVWGDDKKPAEEKLAGPDFYQETIAGVKTGIDEAKRRSANGRPLPL